MRFYDPHNRLEYTVCGGERNRGTFRRAGMATRSSVIPLGRHVEDGLNHLRVLQVPHDPRARAGAATQQCRRQMDAVRFAPFRVFGQIVHVNVTRPSNWARAHRF